MYDREDSEGQGPPRRDRPKPGTFADYRELEHELERFDEDERRAEAEIEAELRREHFGHEPERPPAWEKREDRDRDRH